MKATSMGYAVVLASTFTLSGCVSSFGGQRSDDYAPTRPMTSLKSGVIEVGAFNAGDMAPLQAQIEDLLSRRGQVTDVEAARAWDQILRQYGSYDGRFEAAVLTAVARNQLEVNHRPSFFEAADRLCAHVDRYSVRNPETEFVLAMADVLSDGVHSCDKLDRSGRVAQSLTDLLASE